MMMHPLPSGIELRVTNTSKYLHISHALWTFDASTDLLLPNVFYETSGKMREFADSLINTEISKALLPFRCRNGTTESLCLTDMLQNSPATFFYLVRWACPDWKSNSTYLNVEISRQDDVERAIEFAWAYVKWTEILKSFESTLIRTGHELRAALLMDKQRDVLHWTETNETTAPTDISSCTRPSDVLRLWVTHIANNGWANIMDDPTNLDACAKAMTSTLRKAHFDCQRFILHIQPNRLRAHLQQVSNVKDLIVSEISSLVSTPLSPTNTSGGTELRTPWRFCANVIYWRDDCIRDRQLRAVCKDIDVEFVNMSPEGETTLLQMKECAEHLLRCNAINMNLTELNKVQREVDLITSSLTYVDQIQTKSKKVSLMEHEIDVEQCLSELRNIIWDSDSNKGDASSTFNPLKELKDLITKKNPSSSLFHKAIAGVVVQYHVVNTCPSKALPKLIPTIKLLSTS